jgi:PPM family protein phosphatase
LSLRVVAAGLTDVGRRRSHNEDAFGLFHEEDIFVLADGMGGHASGEVASALAVESVGDFFQETNADRDRTWPYKEAKTLNYDANRLSTAVKLANLNIFSKAQATKGCENMGTTLVAAFVGKRASYIAHVGDSRGYRVRDGEIEQLTSDHSLLNDYLKTNRLTPEEIEAFPHKNVIVRALGMRETVEVDVLHLDPQAGDIFLMCSDGLSGMISDAEIGRITWEHRDDLDKGCSVLIERANENGGHDNVTVVLMRVEND